jgi:hypothetical protein
MNRRPPTAPTAHRPHRPPLGAGVLASFYNPDMPGAETVALYLAPAPGLRGTAGLGSAEVRAGARHPPGSLLRARARGDQATPRQPATTPAAASKSCCRPTLPHTHMQTLPGAQDVGHHIR